MGYVEGPVASRYSYCIGMYGGGIDNVCPQAQTPRAMTPIARWLREARLSQSHPDTGRPWSQQYAAERVTAETGWTLHRENLVGYEGGKGMQPETLAGSTDIQTRTLEKGSRWI